MAAGFLVSPAWFLLLPLSIWIGAERNADARISIALADGDAWINVSNLVGRRLLATAMLIGLVSLGVDGIFAYSIALAIAAAGSSVFANVYVRARVTPRGVGYGEVLAKSRPYWVHSVATQSRNLDATIVGAVAGATAAGLYSAGSRLTNPLSILPYSLATVLLPEATRAHAAGRSLRPSVLLAATMVSVATALYLTLIPLTPWLVSSVLGAAYEGSVVIIQIVLIGFPFAAGTSLVHALLQAIGRKNVVAASSTIFATLTLVGAMVGALLTGAVGAAIALSAVTATQFVYLLVWLIASLRRAGRRTDLSGDEFVV
jgi:O-antigen/teichoic acid export membrane protein